MTLETILFFLVPTAETASSNIKIHIQDGQVSKAATRQEARPQIHTCLATTRFIYLLKQDVMTIGTKEENGLSTSQSKNILRDKLGILSEDDDAAIANDCEYTSELDLLHNFPEPKSPKPAPAYLVPIPSRYPETLGTLVEVRESEGKGLGMFAMRDIFPGTFLPDSQ